MLVAPGLAAAQEGAPPERGDAIGVAEAEETAAGAADAGAAATAAGAAETGATAAGVTETGVTAAGAAEAGASAAGAAETGETAAGAAGAEEPAVAVAETAPAVHDPTLMIVGLTTATVGVVGFATLAAFAVVENARVAAGCGGACSDADRSGAEALQIAANVAAGVALAGAVLSLVGIAVMGRPDSGAPPAREEEITVAVGPGGVRVSGVW